MIAVLLVALALDSAAVRHIALAPRETLTVTCTAPAAPAAPAAPTGVRAPVVLLPGLIGGAYGYRKLTPGLALEGHRACIVEPLGVGASSHPADGDYALDAQADRVAQVLDSLELGPAILVGFNFGASVAMRLAYRHPEKVRGILSLDGGPIDRSSTEGVSMAMKLAPLLRLFGARGIARHRIHDALIAASADSAWVTPEVVEAYAHPIVADLGAALHVMDGMRRARVDEPLRDNLPRIQQPVRLLVGVDNRRVGITAPETQLLAEALPDFAVDSISGSGAYLHEERPDAVLEAIRALEASLPHDAHAALSLETVH